MPVLDNIPVTIDAREVVGNRGKKPIRPELMQNAQAAVTMGETLWHPRAIHARFIVQSFDGESVHLISPSNQGPEATLHVGPKIDLLKDAEEVLVGVGTLGPELAERVQELQREGNNLLSLLLDNAGVLALGAIGESLRCLAEEIAADKGWGVSAALSPGSLVGWALHGQRDLCSLLPLEQIGVKLNSHNVLEPHKSFSSLIGYGPGYQSKKVGSACKFCALQKTCWRRREDPS